MNELWFAGKLTVSLLVGTTVCLSVEFRKHVLKMKMCEWDFKTLWIL